MFTQETCMLKSRWVTASVQASCDHKIVLNLFHYMPVSYQAITWTNAEIVHWILRNKHQWNLNHNTLILSSKKIDFKLLTANGTLFDWGPNALAFSLLEDVAVSDCSCYTLRNEVEWGYTGFTLFVHPSVHLCVRTSKNERKVLEGEDQMQTSEESAERPRLSERTEETKRTVCASSHRQAANNIGFICKEYFPEVLLQETKSNTYVPYQDSVESIINAVGKKSQEIGIPVTQNNKTLPQIHATIKMHKNPVKFRFIIGARNCITKQFAQKLVNIRQLIMKIHRKYCSKIKKEKLKEIIDKAFKGGHNKYIQITSKTARWFHSKKNESFTKGDIFSMIDLVIDH